METDDYTLSAPQQAAQQNYTLPAEQQEMDTDYYTLPAAQQAAQQNYTLPAEQPPGVMTNQLYNTQGPFQPGIQIPPIPSSITNQLSAPIPIEVGGPYKFLGRKMTRKKRQKKQKKPKKTIKLKNPKNLYSYKPNERILKKKKRQKKTKKPKKI